ncbi:acetyl-CoA C-acyltransferase [Cuniculiplasma sp. SKW3]|uniref:acetyl-CoA C-acyltransferase n=1 Tax=unclassified Cuniculiplasma TaxID=2619706 RepID=UPI003FCF7BC8
MPDNDVYIASALRTPIGKFGKSLRNVSAANLGGQAIKAAVEASGIKPDLVEEVLFGNVIQAGNGQNLAGQCAHIAGLPDTVTKNTVNVVCASGMLAMENASREIMLGERDIIVAGGTESMSRTPYLVSSSFRWGVKNMFNESESFTDSLFNDGLKDAFYGYSMGYYADKTAKKYNLTREQLDEFSMESQTRAFKATESGLFAKEIVKLEQLDKDEGIRKTDMESLARLPPAFNEDGLHTAGNSSQISDGASALVLVSSKAVNEYGIKPIGKITGFSSASLDPRDFVEAPIPATKKLLEKKGWSIKDFDLFEHNEAFSAASIIVRDELGIDNDKFNIYGGAIALGHPLGDSGSRIVVTLINALRSNKMEKGLATLCHGGGGGHTMTVEVF